MSTQESFLKNLSLNRNIKEDLSYFLQGLRKNIRKCPYCNNEKHQIHGRKYLVINICRCRKCGLFFVNPMYSSKKNIEDFYNNSYSSNATALPNPEELESMKQLNFIGSSKNYNERLTIISQLSNGNKLLEFGSSWGYFLFQAQNHGFICSGVEISHKRASYGHKFLNVNIFNDMKSISDKFNVIYSAHALEHLIDISNIFDKLYEKLLPMGSLFIEVPNFDPKNKGKSVYRIVGKVHPLGFCKDFFMDNLSKHGFSHVDIAGNYEDLLKQENKRQPLTDVIVIHAKK